MRFLGISFLFLVVALSCSRGSSNYSIIGEEKMVDVLVDIHMADATLNVANLRVVADTSIIKLYYSDVLKKHNFTQKQFDNSIKYYSSKPKDFEKIYEKVSEKLAKLESEFQEKSSRDKDKIKNGKIEKDLIVTDSVKNEPSDYE
jgi:response regulator RpfG family c-di-GMP phosphodiesterase